MIMHRPPWLRHVTSAQLWLALVFLLLPFATLFLSSWQGLFRAFRPAYIIIPTANYLGTVVMYAIVWQVLLQIAQDRRRLSLALAVRAMLHGVLQFAWLMVMVLLGPAALFALLDGVFPIRSEPAGTIFEWLQWRLPELLTLALLFVPWIILRSRLPVRRALARNFALLRAHAGDLAAFALRYLLLIYPLQYVYAMFSGFDADMSASIIGHVVGGLTALVSLTMVALLYLELERRTPRAATVRQTRNGGDPAGVIDTTLLSTGGTLT
jgi:hypothetical protein